MHASKSIHSENTEVFMVCYSKIRLFENKKEDLVCYIYSMSVNSFFQVL